MHALRLVGSVVMSSIGDRWLGSFSYQYGCDLLATALISTAMPLIRPALLFDQPTKGGDCTRVAKAGHAAEKEPSR